jgi:ABC-2 type transport system permease protein
LYCKKRIRACASRQEDLADLFGLPIVQIIIFGFALTNEVKNSGIAILDAAGDISSKKIIEKIEASKYFEIKHMLQTREQIEAAFREGSIKLALVFQPGSMETLVHLQKAPAANQCRCI